MQICRYFVWGSRCDTEHSLRGLARMIILSIFSQHDLIDLSLIYNNYGDLFLNVINLTRMMIISQQNFSYIHIDTNKKNKRITK